jgi:hypothetical protein
MAVTMHEYDYIDEHFSRLSRFNKSVHCVKKQKLAVAIFLNV